MKTILVTDNDDEGDDDGPNLMGHVLDKSKSKHLFGIV